jgi:hypothetical protein
MTLIADIVHNITANPAPVLFLDTCVLLDVVRAPLRSKPDEVRSAQLLLTSVQKNPKTIHLLVPSPVQHEWHAHILERVNECTTAVDACNAVAAICGHLALPLVADLPAGVDDMPRRLKELSADLLAACVTIDHDGLALSRAVDRIIAYRHPVKQPHSKGAKDSVILEHAVETTTQLRNAGFAGRVVSLLNAVSPSVTRGFSSWTSSCTT